MNAERPGAEWEWEELDEVDSTNRLALQRVRERWSSGASAHGRVITSNRQTAGRGQHGRHWESPDGGLYLSVVLEDVPLGWRECLALVAGVVVLDALKSCDELQIRWPNDVMLAGKKVAGILCEALAQGNKWAVVIGIGVNVQPMEFSGGLRGTATSLWERGVRLSRADIARSILDQWTQLLQVRPALPAILQTVRERDTLRGMCVRLDDGERVWEGSGAGIGDDGRLLLEMADGEIKAFARGSVMSAVAAA